MVKKEIAGRLNTRQVMAGFGVSDMTIYTWRQGSEAREKLPCHQDGRLVYFKEAEMARWAKKHGLTFSLEKANVASVSGKSGPKPVKAPVRKSARAGAVKLPPVHSKQSKARAAATVS